jgi:hypothetical protein
VQETEILVKIATMMKTMVRTSHVRLAVCFLQDSNVQPVRVFGIVLRNVRLPTGKFIIENAQRLLPH